MNWKDQVYQEYRTSFGNKIIVESAEKYYKSSKPTADRLIKLLPKDKKINILDLGCGSGSLLFHIKKKGYINIEGVDLSNEQISIAMKFGIKEIYQNDIVTFISNKPEDSINVIIIFDVLEHLNRDEIFHLLAICHQKLVDGGLIIIHTPNAEGIFGAKIRYSDITHEIAFTKTSIKQILLTLKYSNIISHEDKPQIYSLVSLVRRIIWNTISILFKILHLAETGSANIILSQNMLTLAQKQTNNFSKNGES